MANSLIIDNKEEGVDIALLKDSKLIEFHTENEDLNYAVGDVYLGRVRKFSPGINAAFVDIGYGKDGFLHYQDLGPQIKSYLKFVDGVLSNKITSPNISNFKNEEDTDKIGKIMDCLTKDQRMLVQISKEPISTKGARITAEITFAGRYLVLVPFSNRVSVSSRIKNKAEKERLLRLLKSLRPKNFGIIVRTVAEDITAAEVDADLKDLVNKWNDCFYNIKKAKYGQKIIGEMSKASAYLRDMLNSSFKEIILNDKEMAEELKAYVKQIAPDKEKIVEHYDGQVPIFDKYGIEGQLKKSFGKTVIMKSSAYLVIEHTEALHVIDVNSGSVSRKKEDQETNAMAVNMESAEEVARQLRLRDMGGIIVVDFIDLKLEKNRKELYNKMKSLLDEEKVKHSCLPLSKFGLMQITRERVRPVMNIDTTEECPSCGGGGRIETSLVATDKIFTDLKKVLSKPNTKNLCIMVHPFVEAYINKPEGMLWFSTSLKKKWEKQLGKKFTVNSSEANELLEFYFLDEKGTLIEY